MKKLAILSGAALLAGSTALMAAGELMTNVPVGSLTVTDWYKQSVYDPTNTKIGQVMDVLVSPDGKVDTLIVGVGGFLGAGEKDVAVSFSTVQKTVKDSKVYLTMNTTKDALKSAPGFRYDRQQTTWVPDKSGNMSQ
ncbi:MAG: PRC-barrel domain-containing protein [Xanthobacteraceae bacterium]